MAHDPNADDGGRYLRFAWRADGCRGIMVQLHDEKDWNIRYTAGVDAEGWGTRFVADRPPTDWTVVTVDLFKDFGERTIQGIALTAFDGRAGYFDHVYFGRSVDDLDGIDATGLRAGKPAELTADGLGRCWDDLGRPDAAKAYRALWSLVTCPEQAVPFVRGKLRAAPAAATAARIEQWARQLDDNRFRRREEAFKRLEEHVEAAAGRLEQVLAGRPSRAVRARAGRAVRVLEYVGTAAARKCLEEVATDGDDARLRAAARAALGRLDAAAGR